MSRNIEMNYRTESGYEVLYPLTTIAQVGGLQNELNSKLSLSGGTMIGDLILNRDPVNSMQAVTKQYADNREIEQFKRIQISTYNITSETTEYVFSLPSFDELGFVPRGAFAEIHLNNTNVSMNESFVGIELLKDVVNSNNYVFNFGMNKRQLALNYNIFLLAYFSYIFFAQDYTMLQSSSNGVNTLYIGTSNKRECYLFQITDGSIIGSMSITAYLF